MSTVHRGGYTIRNRPIEVDEDEWEMIFKRKKKNDEKSRYKRGKRDDKKQH